MQKGLIRGEFDRNNLLTALSTIRSMSTNGAETVHRLQLYDHVDDFQFCLEWILAAAARISRERGEQSYIPDHPGELVSGTASVVPLKDYDYDKYGVMVAWDFWGDSMGIVSPIVMREPDCTKLDGDID